MHESTESRVIPVTFRPVKKKGLTILQTLHPEKVESWNPITLALRDGECESCGWSEAIERFLSELDVSMRPSAVLLLPPNSDPWRVAESFSEVLRVRNPCWGIDRVVSVIDSDQFFTAWTGKSTPHDPSALARHIDFCHEIFICGDSSSGERVARLISVLNDRAKVHVVRELPLFEPRVFDFESAPQGAVWWKKLRSGQAYRRDRPFHPDRFGEVLARWPEALLRTEGTVWLADDSDVSYQLVQVGPSSLELIGDGYWLATLDPEERAEIAISNPEVFEEWHPRYGDRCNELGFVWENDSFEPEFVRLLDQALLSEIEMRMDWTQLRRSGSLGAQQKEGFRMG